MKIEQVVQSDKVFDDAKRATINVLYIHSLMSEGLSGVMKKHDLSVEQFNVLRILRGTGGTPANMGTIQQRMIAKTSNTTRLVDKLLAKELVIRKICPENRRKMEVSITKKGVELLDVVDPLVDAFEVEFFSKLDQAELVELTRILEKIRS